jgi:hypothetical protein
MRSRAIFAPSALLIFFKKLKKLLISKLSFLKSRQNGSGDREFRTANLKGSGQSLLAANSLDMTTAPGQKTENSITFGGCSAAM